MNYSSHQDRPAIALLGGTFDPIHKGHIVPALTLAEQFGWQRIHLQPCFAPPHRTAPVASDKQRFEMVELASQADPRLFADDFELRQNKPTRTIHTLQHLRQQYPKASICFILGMDSFINFTSWLNWQEILQLAHLIVLPRPGYDLAQIPMALAQQLDRRRRQEPADFQQGAGYIYIASTPRVDVSATELRRALQQNAPQARELIDPKVLNYIHQHQLYQNPA